MNVFIIEEWMLIVFRAVLTIVAVLFVQFGLPYLKNLELYKYVEKAVEAAEKIYGAKTGAVKKSQVVEWVKNYCEAHNIKITEEQINVLIESACLYVDVVEAIEVIEDESPSES